MLQVSHLLKARWIFPVSSPPIEDGVIEIDGPIVRIDSGPEPEAVDLGDVAIIPGLVNTHTHLEFSHLDAPLIPARPFADWIRAVVRARRGNIGGVQLSVERGLMESQTAGTTMLGEIATSLDAIECLEASDLSTTAFWEVLGLDDEAMARHESDIAAHFAPDATPEGPRSVRGLSPHAPYSLHPDLFRWTIDAAEKHDAVVAMHLAETTEELELLDSGRGSLVDMLRDFGLWRDGLIPRGTTILSYLQQLARLNRVLVVHGNYLTDEEIDFIAERPQFSVVYCPRTHAHFGHPEHPWRQLLEHGVNVAIGTDSRASNPDLSVWHELLYLRQAAPDVPGETLLRMATCNGSEALGFGGIINGTIEAGTSARLAVVALGGDTEEAASPYERLLHPESQIVAAMIESRWLHGGPVR